MRQTHAGLTESTIKQDNNNANEIEQALFNNGTYDSGSFCLSCLSIFLL